jgi:biopolymer transport protein ExbD
VRRLHDRRRQAHPPIDLNVIPLIDVVFFLLIFYVISTAFVQETAVPLSRPASSQATAVAGAFVPVAIVKSGAVQIGAQIVDADRAQEAVAAALRAGAATKVVVIPDRDVPTGLLLRVMDACSAAGASSVDVAATPGAR